MLVDLWSTQVGKAKIRVVNNTAKGRVELRTAYGSAVEVVTHFPFGERHAIAAGISMASNLRSSSISNPSKAWEHEHRQLAATARQNPDDLPDDVEETEEIIDSDSE